MKLNKIEKIIVVVIVVGLILGIGIFMFVKPSYEQIDKERKTLTNYQQELSALQEKLARLNTIDADIQEQKNLTKDTELKFYPELTTYEVSEIAMAYLAAANLEAHQISVSTNSTNTLSLSYFTPSSISYEIKTLAATAKNDPDAETEVLEEGQFKDGGKTYTISVSSVTDVHIYDEAGDEVDVNRYTETMKKIYKAAVCKAMASQHVSQITASATAQYHVKGTYKDYIDFIDHIYSLERATTVPQVIIPMTMSPEIDEDVDEDDIVGTNEAGMAVTRRQVESSDAEVDVEDDTIIEQDITLIFLCIDPITAPSTLDIDGTTVVVDQRPAVY